MAIVAEAMGGGCGRLEVPGGTTGIILLILGSGWASVAACGITELVGGNRAQAGSGRGSCSGSTVGDGSQGWDDRSRAAVASMGRASSMGASDARTKGRDGGAARAEVTRVGGDSQVTGATGGMGWGLAGASAGGIGVGAGLAIGGDRANGAGKAGGGTQLGTEMGDGWVRWHRRQWWVWNTGRQQWLGPTEDVGGVGTDWHSQGKRQQHMAGTAVAVAVVGGDVAASTDSGGIGGGGISRAQCTGGRAGHGGIARAEGMDCGAEAKVTGVVGKAGT